VNLHRLNLKGRPPRMKVDAGIVKGRPLKMKPHSTTVKVNPSPVKTHPAEFILQMTFLRFKQKTANNFL
jgi:hypothetical protein